MQRKNKLCFKMVLRRSWLTLLGIKMARQQRAFLFKMRQNYLVGQNYKENIAASSKLKMRTESIVIINIYSNEKPKRFSIMINRPVIFSTRLDAIKLSTRRFIIKNNCPP